MIYCTYEVEGVLDWGGVVHWSEEMVFEGENDNLLEKSISHHELLGGTRDVSVVVEESHTGVSRDLDLKGQMSLHSNIHVGLLGWEHANTIGTSEVIEALVSDFVNHLINYNYIINIANKSIKINN